MKDLTDAQLITLWVALVEASDGITGNKRLRDELRAYSRVHQQLFDEARRRGLESQLTQAHDWPAIAESLIAK